MDIGTLCSEHQRDELQWRVDTLFDAIAHGDAKHRAWLRQAIADHFAGRQVRHET